MKCLPVYLVVNASQSMSRYESMLNQGIESLYDALITSPRISDFAHVSIISFNTDAEVVMQMTDLDLQSMNTLPQIYCGGVANFNAAIELLRHRIDHDVLHLKNSGRQVLRPVAFLLTDGEPTDTWGQRSDEWRHNYEALVSKSNTNHPNVVPFGYGMASLQFVQEIATLPGAAFLAKDGIDSAIQKVIPALLSTLIASANNNTLSLPAEIDGYIRVSDEFL